MITVKEKLIQMLVSRGMFENQAKEVIELSIPKLNKEVEGYTITFDSPSNHYPDNLYVIWLRFIRPIALEWIDKNFPQAWFRPMFVDA